METRLMGALSVSWCCLVLTAKGTGKGAEFGSIGKKMAGDRRESVTRVSGIQNLTSPKIQIHFVNKLPVLRYAAEMYTI